MELQEIKAAIPEYGLRQGADWLYSPEPFKLSKREARMVKSLGHPLAQFQKASDNIYQRSAMGRLPKWISGVLDAGKPEWMVQHQQQVGMREVMPRVIRPDLILTEDGFALTELDSVPGGMGITTWLSQMYSDAGFEIFGGRDGVPQGFRSLMPDGGRILVSEESADYRPEMEWLAQQVGADIQVETAESATAGDADTYRFFEWFDWENISHAKELAGMLNLTSPCKPHLEEKLWLALLWTPALQGLWQEVMRGKHLQRVKDVVPFGWMMDPQELPPHAALPRLGVHSWNEVKKFSQTERRLVVKISGFSELAWGSKSVQIGHDMPRDEWASAIETAVSQFNTQPWVMQEYHAGRIVEHPYYDPESGELRMMKGRVRLCPYYFVDGKGQTSLGGTLATIVPADKKKIHGMKDGILLPCVVEE
ncbi:hypothetical protein Rhal01_03038 [Rubritalea halochordaticola]|uniref:Glutathionylspermidine synthase pre-ATP-grasp-like domain-containing protein n=1 Tax=Rubritalea halochordaticola TaxID=714537 RepID=A0ABP9V701_9BACT